MKIRAFQGITLLFCGLFLFSLHTFACTDFRITAKDGSIVVTRSMEFAQNMHSNLRSSPRGRAFNPMTTTGKPSLSWTSQYGYLYLDGMDFDSALDGVNEAGLSFEYLYLPGETTYQTLPAGEESKGIPYFYFGDWILGNFKTVEEVREALPGIFVFAQKLAAFNNVVFPVHAAIYDVSGKSIIVEFIEGKMVISDNSLGIMTNAPTYSWHITNLRNYTNLSPYNAQPVVVDGLTFASTGQGSGLTGLPGDPSPPSRFVKTAWLTKTALPVKTARDAVNLAEHIINNVDIPAGLIRAKTKNSDLIDTTQWVVFKDITHKIFYYRTYEDMTLRYVPLDKIDFSAGAAALKMPLAGKPYARDVTEEFLTRRVD